MNRNKRQSSLCFCLRLRLNGDVRAVVPFLAEYHHAVHQCKQGMVFADTYIISGVVYCSALTHENVAGLCSLTPEYFYAQSFTFRFTAVFRTTNSFFMCHFLLILTD